MSENVIQSELAPGVALLTLSRPGFLNALNTQLLKDLSSALKDIAKNRDVRVLVLTGDGDKAFVSGADISQMTHMSVQDGIEFAQLGHAVTKLLELMPKPTIAAVNGYALGGGMELAMSCDFILASEHAVFAQPEVGLGVIPGFGGTLRLSKFVGLPLAKELIFSGRKVNATEALRIGLVNQVFAHASFIQDVTRVGQMISQHSAPAIAKAKELLNEFSESVGLNFKLDAEAHAFGRLFASEDQKEGMAAFTEKRKPNFQRLSI